ncbi:CoA transferase [Nocardia sp. alder85J]|uniref:CoA transferase n=1 Tax=Nocardia sp. alder85J TaxID=2862949 RepID=UPI001CD44E45|nr:CoA transferase [Nocardia sp. alder85J]MCX4091938.1 CoA transferase [Nocardia sp. alder85J]
MTAVMQGVRIIEVAERTFVPAASALLSDWGADVIKIEHVERGDAMRGLASSGIAVVPDDVHVLFEHSNRGKRSLGLDLTSEAGRDILHRLVVAPVQFGERPVTPRRAPEFNEHGDEVLAELGLDPDAVLDLEIRGVVT